LQTLTLCQGEHIFIRGQNFGPRSLNALDAVSYRPVGMGPAASRLASCRVTAEDVEITCDSVPGVGAKVLWTVTVAGLSSSNARTGYHPPVLTALGLAQVPEVGAPHPYSHLVCMQPLALGVVFAGLASPL
jgi:hypothetical protein